MISWMQKHKKWLIVTIWISTIAFVGAGFVGWGAYQYGAKAGSVAIVGDIKIDIKEFEQRYSNLYSYYAQIFKEEFDQKKAKEIGLEKEALNSLITEALLLNLAKDFGLIVLDEEMQEKIINTKEFQNNGVFDKKLYIEVLRRAGMKPKDFENSIKKEILLSKLHDILKPVLTPLEFESFGASLFMADKIKYKVLTKNDVDIKYTQDELKKFWQDHKNNYLTEPMYEISIVWVEPKDYNISKDELIKFYEENKIKFKKSNGKIKSFEEAKDEVRDLLILRKRKKEALKKYIEFKKGKIKESTKLTLSIKNSAIPSNIMEEISQKNENS
ncbi:MAG TPA: peptidylprolyl isomerase, partial [Campylobacterales bacterium]|nr:peptidylprolyl isomerase [Campylobacterales bacterium]